MVLQNQVQIQATKVNMQFITEIFIQLHFSPGLKLIKITFKQSAWMKKYIDFKSEKIINAKTDFEERLLQTNE